MIRTTEMRRTTAIDTKSWLKSLVSDQPDDEDVSNVLSVLDALEIDYTRVIEHRELTAREFYLVRNASLLAGILLETHLEDHRNELSTWTYVKSAPDTAVELIAFVLTDAVSQFAESLLVGREMGFKPLTDAELTAVMAILN